MTEGLPLGLAHVVVGGLQEFGQHGLHVLPYVTGFGEHRGIDNGKGHVEQPGDGPGEQRLARAGGSYQQDVGLFDLHLLVALLPQAFVVIVHRHRKDFLGLLLTDDVLVEVGLDLRGAFDLRKIDRSLLLILPGDFLLEDAHGLFDTFVADVGVEPGDQQAGFALGTPAE